MVSFFLNYFFLFWNLWHTKIIIILTEETTMFLKYYSLINYILYKIADEFEKSFDCYPKRQCMSFILGSLQEE